MRTFYNAEFDISELTAAPIVAHARRMLFRPMASPAVFGMTAMRLAFFAPWHGHLPRLGKASADRRLRGPAR